MIITPDQIPVGFSIDDYPPDIEIMLADDPPLRDPVTHKIVGWPKRPIVTPEEAWAEYNEKKKASGI